jgi:hypothetical protein
VSGRHPVERRPGAGTASRTVPGVAAFCHGPIPLGLGGAVERDGDGHAHRDGRAAQQRHDDSLETVFRNVSLVKLGEFAGTIPVRERDRRLGFPRRERPEGMRTNGGVPSGSRHSIDRLSQRVLLVGRHSFHYHEHETTEP